MTDATRREFLGACAALGTAVRLRSGTKPDGMTFGFNTYGMQSLKAEDAIRTLAKTGFDSVELTVIPGWDTEPVKVDAARRGTLRKLMRDEGLFLTALMEDLKPSDDDARHAATVDRLDRAMQLARDISPDSPPLIETVLGGKTWEQDKPLFLRRLPDWLKVADKHAVVVAIKPHRSNAMSRPQEAIQLLRELGDPERLRINFDYSHYAFRDMPLEETIKAALPRTAFVAVKDVIMADGRAEFRLPGDTGAMDYVALLRRLHEGGYRGDVNCEVSGMIWRKSGYDPVAAAKRCYENLAPAFDKAGVKRRRRSS